MSRPLEGQRSPACCAHSALHSCQGRWHVTRESREQYRRQNPAGLTPSYLSSLPLNLFLGPSHYTPRSEQGRLRCTRPAPATVSQNPVIRPCHPLTLSSQPWESVFPHHKNHIRTAFLGTRLSSRWVGGVPEAGWVFSPFLLPTTPPPCSDKQGALHTAGAP